MIEKTSRHTTFSSTIRAGLPYLVLGFAIVALSMSAILVRWANAPAAVNGFYRMLTATTLMAIPLGVQIKRQPTDKLALRRVWIAGCAGIFFALNLAAWNTGALMTSAANVTLLGNTSVIWVPLAALILYKEKLRRAFWGGLSLAMLGAILILGQDILAHPALGWGDVFGLIASLFYSAYLLIMERVRTMVSALVAWYISTVASMFTMLALSLILGQSLVGYQSISYVIFVATGLIVQIGGFLSLNYALGHLPASLVSVSLLVQPVFTAIFAVPLLGQGIDVMQAVGGGLVLGGIMIVHWSRQKLRSQMGGQR